ncbi:cyclic peptide export ABC transporter [Paenibacillus massiliensis]|uniref:cyclic peptide export ABC transporter n=1 Tax=Paenibacillus massiliensis TaxID=225917 RepID=UPI0012B5AFFA|nr:cyclic peptide export ABC transporter [Paenibacillus massiliensis]
MRWLRQPRRLVLLLGVLLLTVSSLVHLAAEATSVTASAQGAITDGQISQIESMVKQQMEVADIPGLSLVIVEGGNVTYQKGLGYADIAARRQVETDTLFELGSNTKAITGLAILKLEQDGKVDLNTPVSQYIPWFSLHNGGSQITLNQFLHHTSGIPFTTIGDIPVTNGEAALQETVQTLRQQSLFTTPGSQFEYTTINYDVLGLVIEQVSGKSYEQYVRDEILEPMGLNHTVLSREDALAPVATGYKLGWLQPRQYDAPVYKGNTPAGYAMMNAQDLAVWIKLQLETQPAQEAYRELIDKSHEPDRTVSPGIEGFSYAAGWRIFQDGLGEWSHGGENPNYSSYIVLRPGEQLGVGVMANLNSEITPVIGQNVMNMLMGKAVLGNTTDKLKYMDNLAVLVAAVALPLLLCSVALVVRCCLQIARHKRVRQLSIGGTVWRFMALLLFLSGFAYCLYKLPDILFFNLPWSFVKVWGPLSLIPALICLFAAVASICLLYLLTSVYPKSTEHSFFMVTILSFASGLGNASLIMIINETFARQSAGLQSGLLLFFVLGIVVYVYGQRLVRIHLLHMTNQILYEKRVMLIKHVQAADFASIQNMEDGKIHAGLNNDTETLSVVANIIVTSFTSLVTLLCCFIYIGLINFYGFLLSFGIILVAAGIYALVGKYANRIYERTRDVQNVFFRYIHDLLGGFKELKISRKKTMEFQTDMIEQCAEYRDQKIKAALAFANVFVAGELLFTIVIGVVVFWFPLLFSSMETSQLRNYIFIFLYMTGPVNSLLNCIPELLRTRISYKRIQGLMSELQIVRTPETCNHSVDGETQFEQLSLENVHYSYTSKDRQSFAMGPVNCVFKAGEITFITGGNGSGKSTLGMVLTGLYHPSQGSLCLNGVAVEPGQLNDRVSAVFNDYYLFSKLYGIPYAERKKEIAHYLKLLRMDEKVKVEEGKFSTTKLSTGQRKRLGLLVTYLEDHDIFFFDEWAADQEPGFREFFYNELLPALKTRGKCVIAITHDDRYFDKADQILEMELGQARARVVNRMSQVQFF